VGHPRALADPGARRLIDAARSWQRAQAGLAGAAPAAAREARARFAAPARAAGRGAAAAAAPAVALALGRDGSAAAAGPGPGPDPGRFSLAAVRQAAALARAGDPEGRLVRLIAEVGVHRAMALLPAPLARAVGAIHEVARLLAGVARGR